ncbi:MBL fold metallo-hydrolase [Nocardioides taihuensis]|uniref:MBL fold metallo-hydrolase n=1 Tax=Nocardioides taihuensis TaxID=1835606 RepID=A0ABW0BLB4_9ACTN
MTRLTHLGGPTVLIELDGWRILTDPTFDPPGRTYAFGLGTSSTKVTGPALEAADLGGRPDVVLVSHDHHADNLDDAGRALLPTAATVITTRAGERRLRAQLPGQADLRGLRPGQRTSMTRAGLRDLQVLATPCRHGPPLSRPVAGPVIGFALTLGGREQVAVWMTGDTVLTRRLLHQADRLEVDILLAHLGSVQFPVTGRLRYSMNSHDAVRLVRRLRPRVTVPVHYEGWSHFAEPEAHLRTVFDSAPSGVGETLRWLQIGHTQDL